MDVCLIPYSVAFSTNQYCFPFKMFDYLASGRPVVSTPVPAVCDYVPWVRVGATADEFEEHIRASLTELPEQEEGRLDLAARNTWDERANRVLSILEERVKPILPGRSGQ